MPYMPPGAYARFIHSASSVTSVGSARILALVGTGNNWFQVTNEGHDKNKDRIYDMLFNENVFEVQSVSSKAVYEGNSNPDNVIYTEGVDYELKDGNKIVWKTIPNSEPKIDLVKVDTDPFINEGSRAFYSRATYQIDSANNYFVEDGLWAIEVTYAAEEAGCYRIVNKTTNDVVGEYVVGDEYNTAIPGVLLKITSTFKRPSDIDAESDENLIAAGDYFVLQTTAAKTEKEPTATIDTATSVIGLKDSVESIEVINPASVVDGTYEVKIISGAAASFQVFKLEEDDYGVMTETLIYPDAANPTATAEWIEGDEIYDIIPGVEIILKDLQYAANDNDVLIVKTEARELNEGIPGEGDSFYVTYKYRKDEEGYDAQYFSDYRDVVAEYGNYEVTASGIVTNSLSLGAEIAFSNGLNQIICVQAKGASDADFCDAIDKLKRPLPMVSNVQTVVPLTTSTAVGTYCKNHVDLMSSYEMGKERMTYLAAYPGQKMSKYAKANDRTIGIIETCQGFYDERVVYVVPGRVVKSVANPNTGKAKDRILPGCYLAVAVASVGLFNDPAEPLTRKTINGFSYLPDTYMDSEMNLMANSGACILTNDGTNIRIRHGLTTAPDEVNTCEITLIQIKDYVIDECRSTCGRIYVGRKNTTGVISDVEYTITNILSQFTNQEIIMGYSDLSVARDTTDPRQINVNFKIEAVYPLNYINITFGFSEASA